MSDPLLKTDRDPVTAGLRAALNAKREEAAERWSEFERERKQAIDAGTDLASDQKTLKRLDDLHARYDAVSKEAQDLEERWSRRVGGAAPVLAGQARDGVESMGAEFLRRLGAGVVGVKALDGTTGGTMVPPFFDPRIRDLPQRSLFVRSLIPVRIADGDKVWYLRQSVATNLAAPVAAGALKPTSVFTVERVEVPVVTVAHITEAIDRALVSDYSALVTFIDGQLRLGVLLAEEDQILNGDGTPPNFEGILDTTGVGAPTEGASESDADAIYRGITAVRAAFHEPDAIVLNPADWAGIRTSKATLDGQYLAAGIVDGDPDRLWGKQVITSPVIAAGVALVGAFAEGATIWSREEARVSFAETGLGDSAGEEMFTRNQLRFRGEERLAFGVERPDAFCQIDLTPAGG